MRVSARSSTPIACLLLLLGATSATASGNPMRLVGSITPIPDAVYANVVVDEARGAAYMGNSFSIDGVSVIDMRDRAHPVLARVLPNPPVMDADNATAPVDVDLVGNYLLVTYLPQFGLQAFTGVALYDISADPLDPTLVRLTPLPGTRLESSQLDPEAESGRPYAYCNSFHLFNRKVFVVNVLTGDVLSTFQSPEPTPCPPFPCTEDNHPHEAMVQRHPQSGRVLDYVGYWDSGLRIFDVTDPSHCLEVGSFDYGPGTPYRNAHGAVVTPSGDWVYVGDEYGVDEAGGIHVLDASACDGTSYCTPTHVGFWHLTGHDTQNPDDRAFPTWLSYDVHNMDPKGENALLVGNYKAGVRLLDTTNKSAPEEISFYLPNNNGGGGDPATFVVGRRTWVALFGSDGLVYASDMNMGFFVLALNERTVLPSASFAAGRRDRPGDGPEVRVASSAGRHRLEFTTSRPGTSTLAVYDVAGRRVATVRDAEQAAGLHVLEWSARTDAGQRAASGVYLARLKTPDGGRTVKLLQIAE